MSKLSAREFFTKYNIGNLLFKNFLNAIKSGKNELSQGLTVETIMADESWITEIEGAIFFVEQVVKKPHKFIIDEKEIVQVEKVKKVNAESIRHLSMHSNLIRDIDEQGNVHPSKVLTTFIEEDLHIYENRFVYTLILRLMTFLEQRLAYIKENMGTFDTTDFQMQSEYTYKDIRAEYEVKVKLKKLSEENVQLKKNAETLERIQALIRRVRILTGSDFYKELSKSKPISPPIMKTNILRVNTYYKGCYSLWLYISQFSNIGYSVKVSETDLQISDDYFDDLVYVAAITLNTVLQSLGVKDDGGEYFPQQENIFGILPKAQYVPDFDGNWENYDIPQSELINEFYYNKIKEYLAKESNAEEIAAHKNVYMPFTKFFRMISGLNEAMYSEVLQLQMTEITGTMSELEKLTATIENRKELLRRHKLMVSLKEIELAETKRKEINLSGEIAKLQTKLDSLKPAKTNQPATKQVAPQKAKNPKRDKK